MFYNIPIFFLIKENFNYFHCLLPFKIFKIQRTTTTKSVRKPPLINLIPART